MVAEFDGWAVLQTFPVSLSRTKWVLQSLHIWFERVEKGQMVFVVPDSVLTMKLLLVLLVSESSIKLRDETSVSELKIILLV